MQKIIILLMRRDDLTHEQFIEYWTQKHTPLLATLPGDEVSVKRYVQLYPTEDSIPGVETAAVDGVAELWVDSVEDAAKWFTSETYSTVVTEDEAKFLDRSKTRFLYATEQVIFDETAPDATGPTDTTTSFSKPEGLNPDDTMGRPDLGAPR